MKNRYKIRSQNTEPILQPSGNNKLHSSRCKLCERMEDGVTSWKSNTTARSYTIRRHYLPGDLLCLLGNLPTLPSTVYWSDHENSRNETMDTDQRKKQLQMV